MSIRQRLLSIFHDLQQANGLTSVKAIRRAYKGENVLKPSVSLLEFYDMQVEEKRKRPAEFSKKTMGRYSAARTYLKKFLDSKGWENIKLNQLTRNFIVQFEDYLLSTPMKKYGRPMKRDSANTRLKCLVAVKNDELKKELLDKDPFVGYKMKGSKNRNIVYLTNEEVQAIKELDYSQQFTLDKVRSLLNFSIYTGLRYSDIVKLQRGDIVKDAAGRTWLNVAQKKTKELLEVPLVDAAIEILQKYKDLRKETGCLLPHMSNQKLNVYLKGIATAAGIRKRLTMHVGRHTFATTALETLEIKTVSKLLGHSSIKSTEIYAKITKQKLSAAISMLNAANAGTPPVHVLN